MGEFLRNYPWMCIFHVKVPCEKPRAYNSEDNIGEYSYIHYQCITLASSSSNGINPYIRRWHELKYASWM
jgi:hypothetical protein